MKVYCEHGALTRELKRLEQEGRVTLLLYPYEMRTKRIAALAEPSDPTWEESNTAWEEEEGTWNDLLPSSKFKSILGIVGSANVRDAKHIDSAHKSGCQAFFSPDRHDIISNGQLLEKLLGIKFYHSHDIDLFLDDLATCEAAQQTDPGKKAGRLESGGGGFLE